MDLAAASDSEVMEVTTTSSLKPSSGDTKTISQPAALAAKALSLTPLIPRLLFEEADDKVEVLGGGTGGCFFIFSITGCSNEL